MLLLWIFFFFFSGELHYTKFNKALIKKQFHREKKTFPVKLFFCIASPKYLKVLEEVEEKCLFSALFWLVDCIWFRLRTLFFPLRGTFWSWPLIKEEQKESALSDCCVSNIGNRVLWPNVGRHIGVCGIYPSKFSFSVKHGIEVRNGQVCHWNIL